MSHEAFMQAIIAEPESDTPRLVYADFLDDNGDAARAEFIRVGCEIASCRVHDPESVTCDHCGINTPLWLRERKLLDKHGQEWLLPLCRAIGVPETPGRHNGNRFRYIGTHRLSFGEHGPEIRLTWRRGFVDTVECSEYVWMELGYILRRILPLRGQK